MSNPDNDQSQDTFPNNNNNNNTDPLLPLVSNYRDAYSPENTHLKTYTAGEDGSRLAAAAKELGLDKARQPRKQVRQSNNTTKLPSLEDVLHLLLSVSTEDARMRAVLASHNVDESTPSATIIGGDLVGAVLGIIKGMVGPAILYLPHGFASAGYVWALPIMAICTVLFLYSSQCLLQAWRFEQQSANANGLLLLPLLQPNHQTRSLSYPELAYRALGHRGEMLVKTGIALMQSGVCLTYLIFVPQNLHTSLLYLFKWNISPSYCLFIMVGLQIPLSWVRDIRKLTPTNLLANLCILYGLGTCLAFALQEATAGGQTSPWQNLWQHVADLQPFAKDWFLFIGTSVLLFEGSITLLVPLQEAVQSEEQRQAFPVVYQRVILGIISFYLFFGLTCWMAFGPDVHTVLTTSLPSGVLATTVQLAYSVAVIFTFPLQNFPCLEITCRTVSNMVGKYSFWTQRNVLSSAMVVLLALVAVATMESLDKVVALMGSLLGCPIAFVFPPLIHTRILGDALSPSERWTNYIVAGLGIVAMILASIATLLTWN